MRAGPAGLGAVQRVRADDKPVHQDRDACRARVVCDLLDLLLLTVFYLFVCGRLFEAHAEKYYSDLSAFPEGEMKRALSQVANAKTTRAVASGSNSHLNGTDRPKKKQKNR